MRTLLPAIILAAILTAGCTRTVYVPTERVRTEYRDADTTAILNRFRSILESERRKESASDSVVERQNETVVLNTQGDTVRLTRDHYIYVASKREKELEREAERKDSVIDSLSRRLSSVKTDSIPVPYPVERKLTKWERTKIEWGGKAMVLIVAAVCVAIAWLAVRAWIRSKVPKI